MTSINQIRALKAKARALMKPQTVGKANTALRQAIALELGLAEHAVEKGLEL